MSSTATRVISQCSFCLKDNTEVDKLIAGAGVYICNECVGLCVEILKAPPLPAGEPSAPWEREMSDEELLRELPKVAAAGALADEALTKWVRRTRAQGVSWARIGAALGMTRQSAWERFSDAE